MERIKKAILFGLWILLITGICYAQYGTTHYGADKYGVGGYGRSTRPVALHSHWFSFY